MYLFESRRRRRRLRNASSVSFAIGRSVVQPCFGECQLIGQSERMRRSIPVAIRHFKQPQIRNANCYICLPAYGIYRGLQLGQHRGTTYIVARGDLTAQAMHLRCGRERGRRHLREAL